MGRRKLEMKLIPEKRARMLTFKNRKESLMKKIEELTTLCDVKACMIIYGPDDQQHPEIYPKDPLETCGIIDYYNEKKGDPCMRKAYGLSCYFKEREKQVEKELVMLREKNKNAKYTTWNSKLECERDPLVLRRLADQLSIKTQIVKSRIQLLKNLKKQELEYQYPPLFGYNESRGEIVNYEAEAALHLQQVVLPHMAFTDDGSEYYRPAPLNFQMNVDDGGSDYLLPLPQSYVNFPTLNQSRHQSEGDILQLQYSYMITDDEGSDQYLLPFN